jgi:hypothetical protein
MNQATILKPTWSAKHAQQTEYYNLTPLTLLRTHLWVKVFYFSPLKWNFKHLSDMDFREFMFHLASEQGGYYCWQS